MKEKNKNSFKSKKGITLIALVVTIVVLLILAAVSISMLGGENGIITQAIEAKENSIIGKEKEAISLAYSNCRGENLANFSQEIVTDIQLQKELEKNGENVNVIMEEENLVVEFISTSHKYTVNQNGNIEKEEELTTEEAKKIINVIGTQAGIIIENRSGEVFFLEENILDSSKSGQIIENNIDKAKKITTNGIRKYDLYCFIDKKGKVYTWGNNESGQLGNGTFENSDIPICISDIEGNALNGKNIIDIYFDSDYSIALDNQGNIYTWGWNMRGNLGNGTFENSNIPICISNIEGNILKGKKIVKILNVFLSTIMVIDDQNKIYTWGFNADGALGNGTDTDSNIPICISDIEGSILQNKKIVEIINDGWSIIARDDNGKIYTWGGDEYKYGILGNGTWKSSYVPICISDIEESPLKGKNITEIKFNDRYAIVKDTEGKVYTWGDNSYGQLGNGTLENSNLPVCVSDIEGNVLKGKKIINIYTTLDTVIVIDSEGKMYTWGNNENGQLGDKTTEIGYKKYRNIPICISDIEGSILQNKKIVEIINDGWSIIVRDDNGKIYTWGDNRYGQLGNGTDTDSNIPICISDIEGNILKEKKITNIYYFNYRGIAIDDNGKVYIWGLDFSMTPTCLSDIKDNKLYDKVINQIFYGDFCVFYISNKNKLYYSLLPEPLT